MTDIERLEAVHTYSNMTWRGLATKIGVKSPQTFVDIRREAIGMSANVKSKILAAFPEIRKEWLLNGEEPMIDETHIAFLESIKNRTRVPVSLGSFFQGADTVLQNNSEAMNEYPKGCLLVLKRVINYDGIVHGRNYYAETSQGTRLGTVSLDESNPSEVTFCPTNTELLDSNKRKYLPLTVSRLNIERIFIILGSINFEDEELIPVGV